MSFVKILVTNEDGKKLEHLYLRIQEWDIPGGKIEEGETPLEAAQRELLERTGFYVGLAFLKEGKSENNCFIFETEEKHIKQVAHPGEKGGYFTEIRWI